METGTETGADLDRAQLLASATLTESLTEPSAGGVAQEFLADRESRVSQRTLAKYENVVTC